jgi:hypothetical protein
MGACSVTYLGAKVSTPTIMPTRIRVEEVLHDVAGVP